MGVCIIPPMKHIRIRLHSIDTIRLDTTDSIAKYATKIQRAIGS
jgi:ribosomal protein S10